MTSTATSLKRLIVGLVLSALAIASILVLAVTVFAFVFLPSGPRVTAGVGTVQNSSFLWMARANRDSFRYWVTGLDEGLGKTVVKNEFVWFQRGGELVLLEVGNSAVVEHEVCAVTSVPKRLQEVWGRKCPGRKLGNVGPSESTRLDQNRIQITPTG